MRREYEHNGHSSCWLLQHVEEMLPKGSADEYELMSALVNGRIGRADSESSFLASG